MAWDGSGTLRDRFESARSALDAAVPRRRRVGRTYQGYIKALMASRAVLLPRVQAHLRDAIQTCAGHHWTRFGWVLFALDGTKIDCVRSVANEEHFGVAAKIKSCPHQLLTTLWHMGTGLPWAWVTGGAHASERDHLCQMIDLPPSGSLIVADAGFTGFDLLQQLQSKNLFFLIRVGANVHLLEKLGVHVEQRGDIVHLWPNNRRKQRPIPLRLIRVHPKGRHKPIFLITNVFDEDRLSEEAAALIYQMRWGVEVFHRAIKQTLQRRKMRSAAPIQASLELHWTVIGLLLMGLLSLSGLIKRGMDPLSWSVAAALRLVRQAMHRPIGLRTLMRKLASATKDCYQRRCPRKARQWPHKKNVPPPGEPRLRLATEREIRLAQRLTGNPAVV